MAKYKIFVPDNDDEYEIVKVNPAYIEDKRALIMREHDFAIMDKLPGVTEEDMAEAIDELRIRLRYEAKETDWKGIMLNKD
jgi:hypothetical protein